MKFNWGHSIIVFFVIFFIWIFSFIIFSLKQNNDLVTKDYYKQGAEYSKQFEINKRSAKYNDSVSINNLNNDILVHLTSQIEKYGFNKELLFYRPSDKRNDLKLIINENSDSILVSKTKLVPGRYLVKFSWEMNKDRYEIIKEFKVK